MLVLLALDHRVLWSGPFSDDQQAANRWLPLPNAFKEELKSGWSCITGIACLESRVSAREAASRSLCASSVSVLAQSAVSKQS